MNKLFFTTLFFSTSVFAQTFNGYQCTTDCSGHNAGYKWAEKKSIDDIDDCNSKSRSFNEGCASYVIEQRREMLEQKTSDIQDEIDDLQNQIDELDSGY